jgi:hypothetical protein
MQGFFKTIDRDAPLPLNTSITVVLSPPLNGIEGEVSLCPQARTNTTSPTIPFKGGLETVRILGVLKNKSCLS